MKNKYALLVVVISLCVGCTQPHKVSEQSSLMLFADSLFQASVDSSYIAGSSVLVFQKGEKLLDKSYGYASLELSVPIPERASFEIGSVTKQFTAATILKLAEEGKISLDDDFTEYLDFQTNGRSITIAMLLNHTSGIQGYTEIPEFWNLSIHKYERDSLVRLVEQKGFLFEPGKAMIYNNSAYFFLGLIIEKVSEKSYEEYLSERIFKPLGMNNTYYCSTSKVIKNKVYGYGYSEDGLKQKPYLDHTWPYAAGSLCSTTEDLLIWMRALHGGKVLNEKSYKLMTMPDELKDGSKLRYAMGLVNYSNFGNQLIGHGGGINGFLSETRFFPKDDIYIICLVNTTGPKGASFFANELTWRLLDKQEDVAVELDIDPLSFAGKYSGQSRGRRMTKEVSALSNAIIISTEGQGDSADTLDTYLGNNTWMDGNNIISFTNTECRMDNISGYYILSKQ